MFLPSLLNAFVGVVVISQTTLAGIPPVCAFNSPLSCHNTTVVKDLCCFNYPGGELLLTQLWDTDPATGPADHWTIHGLWPDNCDGSYQSSCDPNRQFTNITQILESYGRYDLLWYMRKYWLNGQGTGVSGTNEAFWEHEWGKHGTCLNTLKPSCYTDYSPQEEVVDFFQRTTTLFASLPTYSYLAAANIYPTATKNYTYNQVMKALAIPRGVNATIECSNGELYSVYYTFNVIGSIANGIFVPVNPVGEGKGCPDTFKYLPKKPNNTVSAVKSFSVTDSQSYITSKASPVLATY